MELDECQAMRKYFTAESARKAAQEEAAAASNARYEANKEKERVEVARRQAIRDAENEKQKVETEARQAAYKRQSEADDRAYAATERKAVANAEARKVKCGADYKAPRIGMTVDRVNECVTVVKLKGQINRADGVVSTFIGGGAYFHAMDGKIVSWGHQ